MRGLRGRLLLAFLAVILVTLCSVSTALLLLLARDPLEERQAFLRLSAQARGIAAFLRNVDREVAGADPRHLLPEVAAEQEVRLLWADREGEVLFDSAGRWEGESLTTLLPELRLPLRRQWGGEVREGGRRWLLVALPWSQGEKPQGILITAGPAPAFSALRQFRNVLLRPLFQAGLLGLALSALLAFAITRSVARPLQQVAAAADAIAQGDLEARAPVAGPEEVQALARSFNEMSRQVEASRLAQRDLVANVAHDLRTPLTSVEGFAQALVDGTAVTPAAQRQAAEAIYEESRRMRQMVNQLLDLARFEAGQIRVERAPVDLASLARKRARVWEPQAEEAGIALRIEAPEEATIVGGDEGRLAQVLDNLLSNALKHTEAGGRVTVSVTGTPSEVVLAVADTGEGIPPEALERIFERFYRGDPSRGGESTGLGLAIVREIVRAHGGTIRAESVVDVGSKFTVRLPGNLPGA
ncbi:MAG: sensor histidine kinase [Anaerolineales bacterium]